MVLDNIVKSILISKHTENTEESKVKEIFTLRVISSNPEYKLHKNEGEMEQSILFNEVLKYNDFIIDREYLEKITNELRKQLE